MWILPRSPCFPSAQEEEDSTSASSWPFHLLASSASLNGTHSPPASWFKRWKRAPWLRHLFGRISAPSMDDRGVEPWMRSLRATRASHSVRPETVVARTIRATCGPRFTEWCRRYVPDSSFWKTSQGMLALGLEESSEISDAQATELRRLSSGLRMWAHRTNGNGSLSSESWPTPDAGTFNDGCDPTNHEQREGSTQTLGYAVSAWQTPNSRDEKNPGSPDGKRAQRKAEEGWTVDLNDQVAQWPTPGVHNSPDASPNSQRECDLRETVKNWQTPTAECSEEPGERSAADQTLNSQSKTWMTPSGLDVKAGAYTYDQHDKNKPRPSLTGQSRSFPQDPAKSSDGVVSSTSTQASRRRLNPRFVSWLQGWPLIGGNGSDSSGTEWSHYRQRMRSALCRLVSD